MNYTQTNYWKNFYKKKIKKRHSSFAEFCLPFLKDEVIDVGCGSGEDVKYFNSNDIISYGIDDVLGTPIHKCKEEISSCDYIYTRFLWHAIDRKTQLKLLKWSRKWLFIEARTIEDEKTKKIYKGHSRNYVYTPRLVSDLKKYNFSIVHLSEGRGRSIYKGEDPYLVRVIAVKS